MERSGNHGGLALDWASETIDAANASTVNGELSGDADGIQIAELGMEATDLDAAEQDMVHDAVIECREDWVNLTWVVRGDRVRRDHGYLLYSALVEREIELKNVDWSISGISGKVDGNWIELNKASKLTVRCSLKHIDLFPTDNHLLRIGQGFIELQGLTGSSIEPRTTLRSRLVTIKSMDIPREDHFTFGVALGKQLARLGIESVPTIGYHSKMWIKDKFAPGFSIDFPVIKPHESLILQRHGLGGRRKLSCGFFE